VLAHSHDDCRPETKEFGDLGREEENRSKAV